MNQFLYDDRTRLRFLEAVRKRDYLYDRTSLVYKDLELKQRAWEAITVECGIPSVKEARNAWKKMRDNYRDSLRRTLALRNGTAQNLVPYRYHDAMSFLEPFVTSKNFDNPAAEIQNETEPLVLFSQVDNMNSAEPEIILEDPLSFNSETPEQVFVNGDPLALPTANKTKRVRSPPTTHKPAKRVKISPEIEINEPRRLEVRQQIDDDNNGDVPRESAYSNSNHVDIFFKSMCETTKAMPEKWQLEVKKKIFEVVTCAEEDMLKEHQSAKSRSKSMK